MNTREQKGMELAKTARIIRRNDSWLVPSQSGKGYYWVDLRGAKPRCACKDFELRGIKCKHIYAVEYKLQWESEETQAPEVPEAPKPKRPAFRQNWTAYNAAQTNEKALFQVLLCDLGDTVPDLPRTEGKGPGGRTRLPLQDMIFSAAFKVYSTFSGRRFMTDLREAHEKGYISKVPHFNSIFNYLESDALTPILRALITQSSLPLKAIESDFAVDSSGFSTGRFVTWFDAKYRVETEHRDWVKVHLITGVKTNVVTSVEISGRNANDSPYFAPLVNATARHFQVREVSAERRIPAGATWSL